MEASLQEEAKNAFFPDSESKKLFAINTFVWAK